MYFSFVSTPCTRPRDQATFGSSVATPRWFRISAISDSDFPSEMNSL